jgi:hypothetical protein
MVCAEQRRHASADAEAVLKDEVVHRKGLMKHPHYLPCAAATLVAALTLTACVSTNNAELALSHPHRVVGTSEGAIAPPNAIPSSAIEVAWNDAGAVRLTRIANSGFRDPARLVIDDSEQWATVWTLLWAGQDSRAAPALPAIDFTRNSVIVAALGQGSSRGVGIELARLSTTSDTLYVEVASQLAVGCTAPGQTTQPVDIIRIPKPHAPVVFVERAAVDEC